MLLSSRREIFFSGNIRTHSCSHDGGSVVIEGKSGEKCLEKKQMVFTVGETLKKQKFYINNNENNSIAEKME